VTPLRTILLVEDNPDDEMLTLHALRKGRIANDVAVVRDGQEAVDYLFGTGAYAGKPLPPLPQVVLLDLKLPKLDGHEVLARIRADPRTATLPVVLLTSSREDQDRLQAYQKGANSFICKPVETAEFIASIQQLQLYWLVLNEAPPSARP
jgi:two-component system response regulator